MPRRREQVAELLKQQAAAFFHSTTPNGSMVTVTNTEVSNDYQYATIYITVFPDEKADETLAFVQGRIYDLKEHLKSRTQLGRIPWLSIEIDEGEKKRQRLDTLSRDL